MACTLSYTNSYTKENYAFTMASTMAPDRGDTAQFGPWLKARRKALGLSRRELAARANCSEVTVVKVEAGERRPSVQVAGLLAEALDIPAGERSRFVDFARSDSGGWV